MTTYSDCVCLQTRIRTTRRWNNQRTHLTLPFLSLMRSALRIHSVRGMYSFKRSKQDAQKWLTDTKCFYWHYPTRYTDVPCSKAPPTAWTTLIWQLTESVRGLCSKSRNKWIGCFLPTRSLWKGKQDNLVDKDGEAQYDWFSSGRLQESQLTRKD